MAAGFRSPSPPPLSMLPLLFLVLDCLLLVLFSVPSRGEYSCSNLKTVECGKVNISYPFWNSSDSSQINYCGYPGFKVTCVAEYNHQNLILRLGGYDYRISKIDYRARVISLAVEDVEIINTGSDYCPSSLHNVTLSSDVSLSYAHDDVNITFFFNCTDDSEWQSNLISCPGFGKNYVFGENPEHGPENCDELLVLPVLRSNLTDPSQLGIEYAGALRNGFELNWSNDTDIFCANCERSRGRCGQRNPNSDHVSACFYSNGTVVYQSRGRRRAKGLIIGIFVGTTGIMAGLGCFILIGLQHLRKQRQKKEQAIEALVLQYQSTPKRYTYSEIKRMTKSFSDMLGKGGYGSVFKGSLSDGRLVAVKILRESKGNGEEFINEAVSISRTSHVNIVGLLGFCINGSKRALVYEFMPNGSLEKFIFGGKSNTKTSQLSWEKLYNIAIGIARGLEYLHRGCNTRIVHFDIKPHNILLDQDFYPKISDFGLAKMCLQKDSIISTMGMRGTPGYIAPELISRTFGVISSKSDVYSYGMMVLEMVGGRKNFDTMADRSSEIYFPDWVYDNFDKYYDLVTPNANLVSPKTKEIARKMTIVGLWCIQIKPENRPSISMVINMLEGSIMDLQMPPKPELD